MLEIKKFPKKMSELEIDKGNMKKCLLSGLFEEHVKVNGEERRFFTYLTPGLTYNQKCLILVPPADVRIQEYLEKSFWLDFAAQMQVFLHFLEPRNHSWDENGVDADYMNRVYVQVQARDYYVTMQDNIYAIGIGDGSNVAQQAAMKMTSEWAGLITFGNLSESAMRNAEVTQEKEDAGQVELSLNAEKSQLPVWMAWSEPGESNDRIREYWKNQNDADTKYYSCGFADEIYFPAHVYKKSSLNEEKIAQVRIYSHWNGKLTEELMKEAWAYICQNGRHRSFGRKALRRFREPAEYGAEYHEMEVNGFTRIWYEYVPEEVQKSETPVPLVVTMHGRGGSAESFFDLSGMSCVAEERGFIAIFPEAGVYQQKKDGLKNVLLWDGKYNEKSMDDVKFLCSIIEDVKKRYPVDETRIYACGQSSGGMMTALLAEEKPDMFAAVSPWSALRNPDSSRKVPEKICPKVPILFLFGEDDWLCVDREKGQMEYSVTESIAEYLRNLIQIYQLDEKPKTYSCGEIRYYIYHNSQKVPMLTAGVVRGMSHANYPGESWIAYDQFFARFSKEKDGTLLYLGEKVI